MKIVLSPLLICALGIAPIAAHAQEYSVVTEGPPEKIRKLFECREVADPEQRLACFDREILAVQQAQANEELVIADREQVREARKGLFGFKLPKFRLFGGGDGEDEDEINEIEASIASFHLVRGGKALMVLEDGARWMQTDNIPILGKVETGDTVFIERAALGSFKAKIGSRRAFRVERIN